MHSLHVLSLRHVLSVRGDKTCRKVHSLHVLSHLRQQHYNLSFPFLIVCVCVFVCARARALMFFWVCVCPRARVCVCVCVRACVCAIRRHVVSGHNIAWRQSLFARNSACFQLPLFIQLHLPPCPLPALTYNAVCHAK